MLGGVGLRVSRELEVSGVWVLEVVVAMYGFLEVIFLGGGRD